MMGVRKEGAANAFKPFWSHKISASISRYKPCVAASGDGKVRIWTGFEIFWGPIWSNPDRICLFFLDSRDEANLFSPNGRLGYYIISKSLLVQFPLIFFLGMLFSFFELLLEALVYRSGRNWALKGARSTIRTFFGNLSAIRTKIWNPGSSLGLLGS